MPNNLKDTAVSWYMQHKPIMDEESKSICIAVVALVSFYWVMWQVSKYAHKDVIKTDTALNSKLTSFLKDSK